VKIVWWPSASLALLNMPRADAETIDRAVQSWAASGSGVVIHVEGEYRLFVGVYCVVFFVDAETMHVDRVRRC